MASEAIEWAGTPFAWGQSVKGVGCDCKGLIAGVARELGRPEAESFHATFANYRANRPVPSDLLMEGMEKLFDRVETARIGDVLLLNHGGQPGHMAIVIAPGRAVNALPHSAVRVRDLDVLFHKYPLHSVWRWRKIERSAARQPSRARSEKPC